MSTPPQWIDGVAANGLQLRRAATAFVTHNGTALGARAGVLPGGGGLGVTLVSSTITVGSGVGWVFQSGQGMYQAVMPSARTLTLTAAHATLPRIDLVYLRVWDNAVDASGLTQADAVYLAGTAASSPVAPTPAGTVIYLPLATISVPFSGNGAASVSMAVRPYTVAPGGILPSVTVPDSPYTGQFYDDGTYLRRYNGSAWRVAQPILPTVSDQVSSPASYAVATFTDFTAGQWPPITVTVPQSGMVAISIGAAVRNSNTTTSTGWAGWRASGALTEGTTEKNGVCTAGGRTYATRRVIRSGLTPGASLTVTPQYNFSSVNASSVITAADNGQLIVEPIAG